MNKSTIVLHIFVPLFAALFTFLPVQVTLCQAAETDTILLPVTGNKGNIEKKTAVVSSKEAADDTEESSTEDESSLSTGMMIGIGAGTAALIGIAVAVGGGGGGDDEPPAPVAPPTADHLVDAWHAEGNQPGSGKTYTGTYHLYDGGSIGYDLQVSSGEHLVGSGSWRVNEYQLQIHTDHGSLYSGEFAPSNTSYTVIHMSANSQWNLTLTR